MSMSMSSPCPCGDGSCAARLAAPGEDTLGRLLAIFYLPIAVLVLADAATQASRVALRRAIRETDYARITPALLLQDAAEHADPDESLTEAEFLVAVLTRRDLVDAQTLMAVRRQFQEVVRLGVPDDGTLTFNSGRLVEPLTTQSCFRLLLERGRVPADVDTSAPDSGYRQWYEEHWTPRVAELARERGGASGAQ